MPDTIRPPVTIPQELMLARLAQSDQMREFFIQMWLQNPALAKQGGARVASLLAPACVQSEPVPTIPY
ncbi:MAG: hypothetical protein JNK59_06055 [Sterolibacteriaceae bacterium]|jgi:hypothetical protein|uniref:hypothetical protein n=1 Tax=Sulfuritalea sp. TaxID=2480090 RepID=UPI001A5FE4E1|nr:hypothetical protein [Sulfuritalea sp.]MBL8478854.1 hypothetical protein [Sterolibacteriaceae bacterium]MBN8475164.1 hypothetical protein [Sulfuritalea sp.]